MNPKLSGIRLMVQASVGFSVMALFVKLASQTLPSHEIVFFRSLIGSLMVLAVMLPQKIPVWGNERFLMTLRGISGFLALTLHFLTIARLPIGTAVLLNYTSPIFTAILAVLFLRERPNLFLILMILTSFAGVYLLIGGSSLAGGRYVWAGLLSAVFAAAAYVLIRTIKDRENPLTVIFSFTFISTVGSSFLLFLGFRWPNWLEWVYLLGVGVGSFYGQLWMTMALRKAPASLVGPFSYVTPLLTYLYGIFFFNEPLSLISVAGGLLIVASGLVISYHSAKEVQKAPPLL